MLLSISAPTLPTSLHDHAQWQFLAGGNSVTPRGSVADAGPPKVLARKQASTFSLYRYNQTRSRETNCWASIGLVM